MRALATIALALLVATSAHAAEKTPGDFVVVQPGKPPIIVTAPHGGRDAIPGVASTSTPIVRTSRPSRTRPRVPITTTTIRPFAAS